MSNSREQKQRALANRKGGVTVRQVLENKNSETRAKEKGASLRAKSWKMKDSEPRLKRKGILTRQLSNTK